MKPALPLFLRRNSLRLGWPGVLGGYALALVLVADAAFVLPAGDRADAARRTVASLQHRLDALGGPGAKDRPLSLEEQLTVFYGNFPSEQNLGGQIGKLAGIAARHGLALQQVDYKSERDTAGKLTHFQVNLPLRAPYPVLRQFLSALHAEMPMVAVEQVQFERQKIGDGTVDARLRLVLYLGAAS